MGEQPHAHLIVNPYSSSMTPARERAIVQALRDYTNLEVRRTERAGHAIELAAEAVGAGVDVIISCGGDGTINEIVNGMDLETGTADERPALAVVPGGGTNVLARGLGYPNNPVAATNLLISAIAGNAAQPINLGAVNDRRFLFAAGIGLDAEVVKVKETRRSGRRASDLSYMASLAGYITRRGGYLRPIMEIRVDGGEPERAAFVMCNNVDPYSYLGTLKARFMPDCTLEGGLDALAPRSLTAVQLSRWASASIGAGPRTARLTRRVNLLHDVERIEVRCDAPTAVQCDGEYLGDWDSASFTLLRDAVRLIW